VLEKDWPMNETVPLWKAADASIKLGSTEVNRRAVGEVADELTDKLRIILPCHDGDPSSIHRAQ
jgi:hypothetical protein